MGQRLVINIITRDGDVLANAYYHWSAYTMSALEIIKSLIESNSYLEYSALKNLEHNDKVTYAINMLAETGASLSKYSREYVKTFSKNISEDAFSSPDRNEGLIGVGNEINNLASWAESTVDFYVDNQTFDFRNLLYSISLTDSDDESKIFFISDVLNIEDDFIPENGIDKMLKMAIDKVEESSLINEYYDFSSIEFKDISELEKSLSSVGYNFAMKDEDGNLVLYSKIE